MAENVKWAPGRKAQFQEYFFHELQTANDERLPLEQRWRDLLAVYRAGTGGAPPLARYPIEGGANETLPLGAIDTDQLYAKLMQTIHASPDLWSVSPLNERWVRAAKPMQDFLTLLDSQLLRMYNVNKRALLEMTKLGTCIWKTGWTFEQRRVQVYDEMGKPQKAMKVRSMPFVDHVRLADFVLPPYAYAIEPDEQGGAPWVAERIRMRPEKLRMLAESSEPNLPNFAKEDVERVLLWEETQQTEYDAAVRKADYDKGPRFANEALYGQVEGEIPKGGGSLVVREIELWEVRCRYPALGDAFYDDIVLIWHHPTKTILRATLNPYVHGRRGYSVGRYFPGEGFYGIGVLEQKEMFQRLLSSLTNYALNGALLSNAPMIGVSDNVLIGPNEPIYPGKTIKTSGDPSKELFPIKLGQLDSSLQGLIQYYQLIGERRTGVSDIQLGSINELPGRTPATTMVSLLQEGNRRPDLTIKDLRYEGLSRVGLDLIELCQQYLSSPREELGGQKMLEIMVQSLGMPEGMELAGKLLTPMESAGLGLGVTISATSGSGNKEVDRQTAIAMMQMATPVAQQILQLTQLAETMPGTMTGATALKAAEGLTELFRRVLEKHDERDIESVIPSAAHPTAGSTMAGPVAGPMQVPAGAPGAPGMALPPVGA